MKFKNKEYQNIIWDWRSTIYNPLTQQLYPWVLDFLKKNQDINHYLISWAGNISRREELINSFKIDKLFKKYTLQVVRKEKYLKRYLMGI